MRRQKSVNKIMKGDGDHPVLFRIMLNHVYDHFELNTGEYNAYYSN